MWLKNHLPCYETLDRHFQPLHFLLTDLGAADTDDPFVGTDDELLLVAACPARDWPERDIFHVLFQQPLRPDTPIGKQQAVGNARSILLDQLFSPHTGNCQKDDEQPHQHEYWRDDISYENIPAHRMSGEQHPQESASHAEERHPEERDNEPWQGKSARRNEYPPAARPVCELDRA